MGDVRECVSIPVADASRAFQDLNEYVVSLDRIMSRIGTGGKDPQILLQYFSDRDVFRRIAWLRGVMGEALEDVIGEDEVDRIGEDSYVFGEE
ncbi:hypothetical protein [Streptoalloteichus hindustanus]|uniref:hypothetical protein n=1 Tax=Streptoalloteichus hindustanus TaxID=2017 RepID=UPI000937A61F|nr:hypothetical protein [Streptoalloteichus hindustanus]